MVVELFVGLAVEQSVGLAVEQPVLLVVEFAGLVAGLVHTGMVVGIELARKTADNLTGKLVDKLVEPVDKLVELAELVEPSGTNHRYVDIALECSLCYIGVPKDYIWRISPYIRQHYL